MIVTTLGLEDEGGGDPKPGNDKDGEDYGRHDGQQPGHAVDDEGRRSQSARLEMVPLGMEFGDEAGDRTADPQVQESHVAHQRAEQHPCPVLGIAEATDHER